MCQGSFGETFFRVMDARPGFLCPLCTVVLIRSQSLWSPPDPTSPPKPLKSSLPTTQLSGLSGKLKIKGFLLPSLRKKNLPHHSAAVP